MNVDLHTHSVHNAYGTVKGGAAVNLFSGVGWDFAAAELGIDVHGIDNEPTVADTRTKLGWDTTLADINDLDPADWAGVDGLIASPPCQSWSRAGKGAGLDDPRGQLVWQPLVWALAIRPRWVACEQVPEARGAFELIAHRLREAGYHADVYELSAETFGVAQTRRRVFLAAHRDRAPLRPTPTHQKFRKGHPRTEPADMLGRLPWVSMAEALGEHVVGADFGRKTGGWESPQRGDEPAPTVLRMGRGAGMTERHGERPDRTLDEPAFTLTGPLPSGRTRLSWAHTRPSTTVCADPRISPPTHHDGSQNAGAVPWTDAGVDKPIALTEPQGCRLMGFPDGTHEALCGSKADRWRIIGNAVRPGRRPRRPEDTDMTAIVTVRCSSPTCTATLTVGSHQPVVALELAGWKFERQDGDWLAQPYCPRCRR